MFVRFRERKSGGVRPEMVDAMVLCEGDCMDRTDGHRYRCLMKPRCRWHVGLRQNVEREPYRLLVSLIENRRVNGRMQQEYVADLGAIDGHMLPGFYAGIDPTIVGQITADGWSSASLEMRLDFWQNLNRILSRLSNRIDAATQQKIMDAINARISLPEIDEIERTPLRRAEHELATAENNRTSTLECVETHKQLAAHALRAAKNWQEHAEREAQQIALWRAEINRLKMGKPIAGPSER
jgi:hypothetical protein